MSWLAQQNPILIVVFGLMTFAMAMLGIMIGLVQRNKFSHYEKETHRAVLSAMRESYESQISLLTKQMIATEDRWRDANHLLMSAQSMPPQNKNRLVQSETEFLHGFALKASDYVVDQRLIVVLTPFSEGERRTFEIIQKVCGDAGFRCVRGDEDYTPTDILSHVVRLITKARIVIANISSRNPNVFYELGIAHALGKQTILVSQSIDQVPFDVAGLRILIWKSRQDLEQGLSQTLLRTISDSQIDDGSPNRSRR